jgi:YggT family protein
MQFLAVVRLTLLNAGCSARPVPGWAHGRRLGALVRTSRELKAVTVSFVGHLIDWILWIFLLILFARMILSWVPVLVRDWEPRGPMLVFAEIIYSITDPPLRLLRKVLKPVRVGNMMLDLAFIGLAIGVSILMQINRTIFIG